MSDSTDKSQVSGPSTAEESEADAESIDIEDSKVHLKTALLNCERLLLENNHIASEPSTVIKEEHMEIGEKMYRGMMETVTENNLVVKDELIMFEEVAEQGVWDVVEESALQSDKDDDYEPHEKNMKDEKEFIPLDYKIKVVNLAKMHPKWSLKSLQRKGGNRLKRMDQLKIWDKHIKSGGTIVDKYNTINSWTYNRFIEARQSNQKVTTRKLQIWALAAASQFPDLEFKASDVWVHRFKVKHRIRQRIITKSD